MTHAQYLTVLSLTFLILASACGVKSAPTPVLDEPPSVLQQEANRRAAEAAERKKDKQKGEKRP